MTLPAGWRRGLTPRQVESVLRAEREPLRRHPVPHHKGYIRVTLPRCHPYAVKRAGYQLLHRLVMMRALGRRLEWWEHTHHPPGVPLDCEDWRRLEVWEETEHGRYHCGRRLRCGREILVWKPRDRFGRFTPLPRAPLAGPMAGKRCG